MGPMGRTIEDLELCMKVFMNASVEISPYNHGLVPASYSDVQLPSKLRIGYYMEGS
jgi:hypothetical protein